MRGKNGKVKIKLKKHGVQHEIDMFDGNFSVASGTSPIFFENCTILMGSANPKCSLGPPIDWTSHNKVILPPGWISRLYENSATDPKPGKHVGHWGKREPLD